MCIGPFSCQLRSFWRALFSGRLSVCLGSQPTGEFCCFTKLGTSLRRSASAVLFFPSSSIPFGALLGLERHGLGWIIASLRGLEWRGKPGLAFLFFSWALFFVFT